MVSALAGHTILDDWQLRRQRLAAAESIPESCRRTQLQVLDYLVRRYGDSPEVAHPARFPATATFYSNDRLIVVHHHLGRGQIAGVKNKAEAVRRVGDVLAHMRRVHEEPDEAVSARNDFAAWVEGLNEQQPGPSSAWYDIWRQLKDGWQVRTDEYRTIAAALDESPYLPAAGPGVPLPPRVGTCLQLAGRRLARAVPVRRRARVCRPCVARARQPRPP